MQPLSSPALIPFGATGSVLTAAACASSSPHAAPPPDAAPAATPAAQALGAAPAFLTRTDLHCGVASSEALRLAGINADTPDPPGGLIERDADGQPTGILRCELSPAKCQYVKALFVPSDLFRACEYLKQYY